jgi:hypothetical protein
MSLMYVESRQGHIASIREECSKARVIVVTTFEGDYAIQRARAPLKVFSFESGNRH